MEKLKMWHIYWGVGRL